MPGEFVDTNVFVHAHDTTAGSRRDQAISLLERLGDSGEGVLSTQVLMEFYVTVIHKIPRPLKPETARDVVRDFGSWRVFSPQAVDVVEAIRISLRYRVGFWDAMIVRAAAELGATILWTEDLANGQVYEGVTVRNPFAV